MRVKQFFSLLALFGGFYLFSRYFAVKAEIPPNGVLRNHSPFLRPFPVPTRPQPRQQFFAKSSSETGNGILDTISLSFVGNFNFANAVEGIRKIVEGIASFIDLDVISVAVEMVLDRFLPSFGAEDNDKDYYAHESGIESRIDVDIHGDNIESEEKAKNTMLKEEITTVVGAILDKQKCWEKTACVLGKRTSHIAAKDVFFIMVEKMAPGWKSTLDLVRGGAMGKQDCQEFECAPKKS